MTRVRVKLTATSHRSTTFIQSCFLSTCLVLYCALRLLHCLYILTCIAAFPYHQTPRLHFTKGNGHALWLSGSHTFSSSRYHTNTATTSEIFSGSSYRRLSWESKVCSTHAIHLYTININSFTAG